MENRNFYVYAWFRDDYGKPFYIGKGKGNRCNITEHRSEHFKRIYKSKPTHVVILQSGLTEEEAFKSEKDMIFYLINVEGYSSDIPNHKVKNKDKTKHLVNCTWGGEGSCGFTFTQSKETVEKRVAKLKGQKRTDEQKERMKESSKKRFSKVEEVERLKTLRVGAVVTEETRKKISNKAKERYINKENNPNYGNKWTEEQKEKQKECVTQKTREIKGTKIYCIELDKIFISISEANEFFKENYNTPINKGCLRNLLTGKSKKGWYKEIEINGILTKLHWEYFTPATTE